MIQCFAVFKEINTRWNYVNDPKGQEYIAYASESLQHFSGDCDDHAILMTACIKAIGGTARIIHTGGHLYPEMLIGNKNDLGFTVVRVLGNDMKPENAMEFLKLLQKSSINIEQLQPVLDIVNTKKEKEKQKK